MGADNKDIAETGDINTHTGTGWGYRHQQSIILFVALTVAISMRSCMGVALVAMTRHDRIVTRNDTNATQYDRNVTHYDSNITHSDTKITLMTGRDTNGTLFTRQENLTLITGVGISVNDSIKDIERNDSRFLSSLLLAPPYPQFDWSKKLQDAILSSFFWGYMTLQIPAGQLLHRFGVRYLMTLAMFVNCVISLFIPLAAYHGGWICLVIFRAIQGLSQAFMIPGIHTFFGKWATLEERGRLTAFTYGGQALGTVLGLPLTGYISSSSLGWPGAFRFYGVLSGIAAAIVWWFTADTPASHPRISAAERKYIEDGLGQKSGYEKVKLPVPWSKILRHGGVYAIIVSHISATWGHITLYSEVPAFMDKVMGVNIKANGLLTALPFLAMWIASFFFSWFTDMIIVKKVMSVTHVRKLANSMGCIPATIGLIAVAYVPKNLYVVETILVLVCAFKVSTHTGFQVNHIDISPNFAGTLMSMSNFVSNAVASLAPIVAGFILTDVKSEHLWNYVFFIAAGLYFFSNLFYLVYGTAEKADWNDPLSDNAVEKHEISPMLEKKEESLR